MNWIKRNKIIVTVVTACILLLVGYFLSDNAQSNGKSQLNYVKAQRNADAVKNLNKKVINEPNQENKNNETIAVYLCGSVKKAGVVKSRKGEILSDIINQNGGFGPKADYNRINLARAPKNGEKIYIPYVGEKEEEIKKYNSDVTLNSSVSMTAQSGQTEAVPSQSGQSQTLNSSNKVNINTANENILETIPNIGPSRAKAIIDYRNKYGAFKSIDDLDNVNRIGKKIISSMRDYICIE